MNQAAYGKAIVVGLIGSAVVTALIKLNINVTGMAPFNMPPVAVFLQQTLEITAQPAALALHFIYGALWSVIFVAVFKDKMTIAKGFGLSAVMWLIMMVVFSPIMGWGFFGFGAEHSALAANNPLYLGNPAKYAVMTLVVHLIYGLVVGFGNSRWIRTESSGSYSGTGAHSTAG